MESRLKSLYGKKKVFQNSILCFPTWDKFWNKFRFKRNCKDSALRLHVPFTQSSLGLRVEKLLSKLKPVIGIGTRCVYTSKPL